MKLSPGECTRDAQACTNGRTPWSFIQPALIIVLLNARFKLSPGIFDRLCMRSRPDGGAIYSGNQAERKGAEACPRYDGRVRVVIGNISSGRMIGAVEDVQDRLTRTVIGIGIAG